MSHTVWLIRYETSTYFQQKEDPAFEAFEKIKATEERLKAELRSDFYISTLTTQNDVTPLRVW